ncbi:MAG: protein kinase [Candidatus Riflebacteria bacterium]|nr:protein kinase [Candidatus Riflebacteria bacterium]
MGSEATRVTQEGQVVGTFPYMAVEQLLGQDATARCDVYSFGLMLYELAAGRAVFSAQAESPVTPIQRLAGTIPPISDMNPRVPASLDQLITRCVSREPAARPADGMALAAELARLEASRARQKTVTLQMQLMSPKSPATPVTPACSAIGATPAPPARAGREMTPTGPERTRRLVARDNVSVAEGVAMQRPQTRVLVGGLLALGLGVTCYLAGKWSAGASPAGVEPSARAQSSPAPGVRAPGTPRASMGLAELGRAVSEKLMLVRRELGTGWLKTFALQHRAVLQDATKSSKDVPSPGRTQAALRGLSKALRDHLERLGALEPVEALLARAPKYFGDASIPERERWLTRSSLCDLEMLQYFCIEHRVPWCLRASVEGCAGEWDCPAQPQTVDLKSNLARSWARDTRSGVDRYFPGGSWLDVWPLPDLGEDQRALLWFTTLRWPSRLVLDLLVNGALRKLIRFSKPTAGEDTMLVRVLAEAPGATSTPPADRLWTVTGTSMDPTIRGYTGIWLPRVFVTRRLEIRIRMVDLPLTALGIDDPALIDRVISFVPDPRKKRSGPH